MLSLIQQFSAARIILWAPKLSMLSFVARSGRSVHTTKTLNVGIDSLGNFALNHSGFAQASLHLGNGL